METALPSALLFGPNRFVLLMSYADAFVAALAIIKSAELVTGDAEFKPLEKEIKINWLK